MKSILKIAVEAMITVSLIALLSLLIALVYGLLSLLSPSQAATPTPAQIPAVINALPHAREARSTAKDAPQLVNADYNAMTTRELRPLAKSRKIPRWNKLTKEQLIAALSAKAQSNR